MDCKLSDWKPVANCSKPCGGGGVEEHRHIIQPGSYGGRACPHSMHRFVACNTQPCSGLDCLFSEWTNDGTCSKTCGGGAQRQYRTVTRHEKYGGRPCQGQSLHRSQKCKETPCPREGFDPIAAGRLTGFDFDIAEYCEEPDLCSLVEAVELKAKPPTSSTDGERLSNGILLVLLLLNAAPWISLP